VSIVGLPLWLAGVLAVFSYLVGDWERICEAVGRAWPAPKEYALRVRSADILTLGNQVVGSGFVCAPDRRRREVWGEFMRSHTQWRGTVQ
jgi:hypothetical protein